VSLQSGLFFTVTSPFAAHQGANRGFFCVIVIDDARARDCSPAATGTSVLYEYLIDKRHPNGNATAAGGTEASIVFRSSLLVSA
jgi:hypothetical protein